MVFWRAIVGPRTIRRMSQWQLVPCLLAADVQNTALAAMLTFSHRVLYPFYSEVPRLGGLSVLEDQAAAGVLMWLIGSFAFLPPLVWIGVRLLSGTDERTRLAVATVHRGGSSELTNARSPTAGPPRGQRISHDSHIFRYRSCNRIRSPAGSSVTAVPICCTGLWLVDS